MSLLRPESPHEGKQLRMPPPEIGREIAVAAIDQPGVDQKGGDPRLTRRQIVFGVVSDHEALLRLQAEGDEQIVEILGIGLAETAVLEGGDMGIGEVVEISPGKARLHHGAWEDGIGRDDDGKIAPEAPLHDLAGQGEGMDVGGQLVQIFPAEAGQTGAEQVGGDPQPALHRPQEEGFIGFSPGGSGGARPQQRKGGGKKDVGESSRIGQIREAGGQRTDIGGDELLHLHLQKGPVQIEEDRPNLFQGICFHWTMV